MDLKNINLTNPRYFNPLKGKFVRPRVPGSLKSKSKDRTDRINGKDTPSVGSLKKNEPKESEFTGFKYLKSNIGASNHNSENVRNNIRNNERLMKEMSASGGLNRFVDTEIHQ